MKKRLLYLSLSIVTLNLLFSVILIFNNPVNTNQNIIKSSPQQISSILFDESPYTKILTDPKKGLKYILKTNEDDHSNFYYFDGNKMQLIEGLNTRILGYSVDQNYHLNYVYNETYIWKYDQKIHFFSLFTKINLAIQKLFFNNNGEITYGLLNQHLFIFDPIDKKFKPEPNITGKVLSANTNIWGGLETIQTDDSFHKRIYLFKNNGSNFFKHDNINAYFYENPPLCVWNKQDQLIFVVYDNTIYRRDFQNNKLEIIGSISALKNIFYFNENLFATNYQGLWRNKNGVLTLIKGYEHPIDSILLNERHSTLYVYCIDAIAKYNFLTDKLELISSFSKPISHVIFNEQLNNLYIVLNFSDILCYHNNEKISVFSAYDEEKIQKLIFNQKQELNFIITKNNSHAKIWKHNNNQLHINTWTFQTITNIVDGSWFNETYYFYNEHDLYCLNNQNQFLSFGIPEIIKMEKINTDSLIIVTKCNVYLIKTGAQY